MSFEALIKAEAVRLGFSIVGITNSSIPPHINEYKTWISQGYHADMDYLATPKAILRRTDPNHIHPDVKSIISLGYRYSPPAAPLLATSQFSGIIASYAQGPDYHRNLKTKLIELCKFLENHTGKSYKHLWYSDTGAILEKEYAMRAGLGWIGKNSCLITRNFGSYIYLSEIFTNLDLKPDDNPGKDSCGKCNKCIEACPTGCISHNRTIDSRRCISYLTIENKGMIPLELRPAIGNNIFGCDICQLVCPWNREEKIKNNNAFQPPNNYVNPDLRLEILLSQEGFSEKYDNSTLRRIHRDGYLRNVAIALGNIKEKEIFSLLVNCFVNESDPFIKGHIAWAIGQNPHPDAINLLVKKLGEETNLLVLAEIQTAIIPKTYNQT